MRYFVAALIAVFSGVCFADSDHSSTVENRNTNTNVNTFAPVNVVAPSQHQGQGQLQGQKQHQGQVQGISAPITNAPGGVNVETKAYSFAGTGLAASANACQGSLSVGPFGGTFSVEFCKFLAIADGMRASGFAVGSVQGVLCKIPEVSDSAECKKAAPATGGQQPARSAAVQMPTNCVSDPYIARRTGATLCK